MIDALTTLAASRREGTAKGMPSVCSAHPLVVKAAAREAADAGAPLLIEATCNQVNQFGGYTGMQPADFVSGTMDIARRENLPAGRLIFGGDHLGPNPWRDEPAESAMRKAEDMVDAYARAGFRKLHLDASMGCGSEAEPLGDATIAERAARLAARAERTAAALGGAMPVYVIGTEVPPPGGAHHAISEIEPTSLEEARNTLEVHREVFRRHGLDGALSRVIAIVVQPGVEFGNENVILYDRARAARLPALLAEEPNLVYEAHSTDYQGPRPLRALVEDGFAILKVGPELTYRLREALYGLDLIASDLFSRLRPPRPLCGDGTGNAGGRKPLAEPLPGNTRSSAARAALLVFGPHPILLGPARTNGGGRAPRRDFDRADRANHAVPPAPANLRDLRRQAAGAERTGHFCCPSRARGLPLCRLRGGEPVLNPAAPH